MTKPPNPFPASTALLAGAIQTARAFLACEQLVIAYQRGGERGGSIAWDDIDIAYATARKALGLTDNNRLVEDAGSEDEA